MLNKTELDRAMWRKSRRSGGASENCVEVARMRDVYAVRDSKNPSGPALTVGSGDWRALTDRVKSGTYDL